jgi:molybdenum-dependent DNA-binding transcriptional regulator ModE
VNLVHLKVLAAVARHGSVTEAAKELHYSQPSVSHHLSRLEAETGAKLVQRVGRGIRLTPEGQLLANRASEIVGRVEAATKELAAQAGLQAGRVRLAANASVLSTIVPKAAATLGRTPSRRPYDGTDQLSPPDLRRHLRRATRPARNYRTYPSHPRLRLICGKGDCRRRPRRNRDPRARRRA